MSKSTSGQCSNWKAWHDFQPPGPATLHVTGECKFATGGYRVELEPAISQGINPNIYILDKVVQKPTGQVKHGSTTVPVEYAEKTAVKYTQVEIRPDGVRISVEEVH